MLRPVSVVSVLLVFFIVNLSFGQSKADRKDEKREDARVHEAKKDLQDAQKELSAWVKAYRMKSAETRQAETELQSVRWDYSLARESAEEKIADNSGLPEAIRKMRGIRNDMDALSKLVLEQVHKTDKWKAARQLADESQKARDQLLSDESQTDEQLAPQLKELERNIAGPSNLDSAALAADAKIAQHKIDYHSALDSIAELRRKIDASQIDADPQVKSLKVKVEKAERELANHQKAVASLNAKVAHSQANLVNANRKLQQAIAADKADSNKNSKKK